MEMLEAEDVSALRGANLFPSDGQCCSSPRERSTSRVYKEPSDGSQDVEEEVSSAA